MGDFGSKVQTLVRHLAHIKITEPSAKSIVFSAWEDSLHSKWLCATGRNIGSYVL